MNKALIQNGTADDPFSSYQPLKILLAEDDPLNQKSMTYFLAKVGHQIKIANNGFEVLTLLSQESFDVILMDLQMPEMDDYLSKPVQMNQLLSNLQDIALRLGKK